MGDFFVITHVVEIRRGLAGRGDGVEACVVLSRRRRRVVESAEDRSGCFARESWEAEAQASYFAGFPVPLPLG